MRLLVYLALGLCLGASSVLAFAGTYNASVVSWNASATYGKASAEVACSAELSRLQALNVYKDSVSRGADQLSKSNVAYPENDTAVWYWWNNTFNVRNGSAPGVNGVWGCPNGGALSVENGVNTCTKACTPPLSLQADGSCSCGAGRHLDSATNTCVPDDKCAASKGKENSGWVVRGSGGYGGTVCIDGCNWQQVASMDLSNPQDERIGKDGRVWGPVSQTGLGTACSAGTADQGQPDQNNKQAKKPNCDAGQGVMTSSSGKVLCVPEGTPDARKPDVQKKTQVEKYPDNTTKTTESTTTTDPQTNAKETVTNTTTTGGSSGSAGTTQTNTSDSGNTGTGGKDGSCTGDECTDNAKAGKFGEYGKLWDRKYPDGLEKVVKDKVAEMKNTAIFRLANDLAPQGIGNGGTCPAWTFNANIGPKMNFGSGSYAPPCWLWTALRAVFLVTALLLARRLIFGG